MTRLARLVQLSLGILASVVVSSEARAGSTLAQQYDVALRSVNGGAWFKDANNEQASLAWGESYVMASLVTMYRATLDVAYLERLVEHADGVLAQRDDVRNVKDYRERSEPCWRANKPEYATKPYCFAVHTGMIASPMVEFAALVKNDATLGTLTSYDGKSFAEKADVYIQAGIAAAKVHDDEWRNVGADDGYYLFRPDMAGFYPQAGQRTPLNMMNAMGLLHLALSQATGDPTHADRARRLANHFHAALTTAANGAYAWNYRDDRYVAPGEDVSHGALNVDFAVRAAESNVVFGAADLAHFAKTFTENVYVDSATSYRNVGGGSLNIYQEQLPRWSLLAHQDPSIHAANRNYLPAVGSMGSILYGLALLVRTDRFIRPWNFYVVDWQDLGGTRRTTKPNANIVTKPDDPKVRHLIRLKYQSPTRVPVQQWDGKAYHTVAVLAPSATPRSTVIAIHPEYYFDYGDGAVVLQFKTGAGFVLDEPESYVAPRFTSSPPTTTARVGEPISYTPQVEGDGPFVLRASGAAEVSSRGGTVVVTPRAGGTITVNIHVENDYGAAEQVWSLADVDGSGEPRAGDLGGAGQPGEPPSSLHGDPANGAEGDACGVARRPISSGAGFFFAAAALALAGARRRRLR
jgi:hypothetical protein